MVITIFLLISMSQYHCQTQYPLQFKSSSNITNKATSNRISTQFDGANSDIYLQYLSLNGTTGIQAPLANASSLNTNLDYTIMVWLKPQGDQWNKRIQYILQISKSFQCYFTQTKSLTCESISGFEKLNASTGDTRENQWVHMTVSGSFKKKGQSYLLFESPKEVIGKDNNSYIILQQPSSTWNVNLGYQGSSLNFVGGIKDFIFLSQFIEQDQAMLLKNNYLTWDFKILGYYRFNEATYLRDEFRNWNAVLIGAKSLKPQRDLVSNDICYPFLDYQQYLSFNEDNVINNMTIGSRWSALTSNYSYSLSIWIKPNKNTCFEPVPNKASKNCNIVQFYGSFMIYFDTLTTFRVYFFAKENYYEIQSSPLFAPLDQWINIQLAFNQYSGYIIKTYDMQGREMQSLSKTYNMQEQSLIGKNVGLLQSFRGQARSFIMWSKYLNLPLTNSINDKFSDKNIMFYFKFSPQYNSKMSYITNYGDNSGVTQNGVFNKTSAYEYEVFYDSIISGSTDQGLITSDDQIFDGIACNDRKLSLQMINTTSFVKGQTSNVTEWLNETTVEFWFRPYDISSMGYLFSMYQNSTQSEFFSIYFNNANAEVVCAPFGSTSVAIPYVSYDGLTGSNIANNKWFHLACSYTFQNQINAYLHTSSVDESYSTDISSMPNYLPKDTYTIYIGNNFKMNQGSPNVFFKDLRIWAQQRSQAQISNLRYQQLNPQDYSTSQLIGYFRMTEASFNEFNYESLANNKTSKYTQINQIQYKADSDLVICPQATYYSNNSCYDNPFDFLFISIFPVYDSSSNSLSWNITTRHSPIMDYSLYDLLEIEWSTSDSVINQITSSQSSSIEMIIPSSVFADQSIYQINSQVTNAQSTFSEEESVQFVPISCQWVIVEGSDSYSGYLNFQNPQSTKDITFTLKVQKINDICDSYYNTLLPNITYNISPPPTSMPLLSVTQTDSSTLIVTLPREEQYKLKTIQDNKIIISVYWTNTQYSQYINPTQYTFQNVLYTINFAYQVMTVVPVLTASSLFALQGETITLDASQTYLTTLASPEKYNNLTFSWLCPFSIDYLCQDQDSSVLVISYQDFINVGGILNQSQTFDVQVVWSSPDGSSIVFYDIISIIWYAQPDPSFQIQTIRENILTTGENTFQLLFDNYSSVNVTDLQIKWSIVPNISTSAINRSSDNASLTIGPNAFKQNYKYTISVTATNKIYPIANRSKTFIFTTGYPPYGGTANITPSKGFYNYTNFTVYLSNWTSSHQPIQYQVWQTNSSSSSVPYLMMSAGWISYQDNFTFQANSSNPYIVILSDSSQETVYSPKISLSLSTYSNTTSSSSSKPSSSSSSKVKGNTSNSSSSSSSNVTAPINSTIVNNTNNTQSEAQTPLIDLIQQSTDMNKKYAYMTNLSNSIQDSSGNQKPKIQVILDMLQQDNDNYNESDDDDSSSIVVGRSAQILNNLLVNSALFDEPQIVQSVKITEQIKSSPSFGIHLSSDEGFLDNYAQALSSLLEYNNKQVSHGNRRRNLQSALNIGSNITKQITSLSNSVCSLLLDTNQNNQQTIETSSYQLQFYKFGLDSHAGITQVSSYTKEDSTFIKLDISKLNEEVQQIGNIDASSLCAQTIYYQENPMLQQMNEQKVEQYSKAVVQFDIVDGSLNSIQQYTDLQLYTQLSFQTFFETFKNNQTVCMENSQTESVSNIWTPQYCLTNVLTSQNSVICYCKQSQGSYFTLAKANNGVISSALNTSQTYSSQIMSSSTHSFAFLSFIITMIFFIIFLPVIAFTLDRRDIKCCQEKIDNKARLQLLQKVSQLSNEPLSYWIYKQDQVLSYNLKSVSLFSHLICQMHPLVRIISKFDIQESRIIRFSIFLFQLSIYSLICVQAFGPNYRSEELLNGERNEQSIDQKDINMILMVGIVGMIVMLPLPASMSKCLRSKHLMKSTSSDENKQVTDQSICNPNNQSIQRAHIYPPECNQEQNMGSTSIIINKSLTNILENNSQINDSNLNASNIEDNNESRVEEINIQLNHDLIFKPQCIIIKYFLIAIAYMLAFTSMALSVVYSQKDNQFNQYCMIASFYIGLFGCMFCTSVLRIFIQSILVKSTFAQSNRCFKLFISSEARRINQEIELCREAEKIVTVEQQSEPKNKKKNKSERILKKQKQNRVEQIVQEFNNQTNANFGDEDENQKDNIFQGKSDSQEYLEQNAEIIGTGISPKKDRVSDIFQRSSESVKKSKSGEKAGDNTFRRSVLNKTKSSLEKQNKTMVGLRQVKYSCVTENEQYKQQYLQEEDPSE